MRENIGLYRGKRIDNGEWIEGFYFVQLFRDKPEEVVSHKIKPLGGMGHEVDPDTIGECTGLKDKYGKLIFEGDALTYGRYGKVWCENLPVEWDERFGGWSTPELHRLSELSGFECEIIGNIHDNPELLKGGEG